MNAREIKRAFEEMLPVVVCLPNQQPVVCSCIEEVVYSRSPYSGKKVVSCVCRDAACRRSLIRAKGRYLKFLEDIK